VRTRVSAVGGRECRHRRREEPPADARTCSTFELRVGLVERENQRVAMRSEVAGPCGLITDGLEGGSRSETAMRQHSSLALCLKAVDRLRTIVQHDADRASRRYVVDRLLNMRWSRHASPIAVASMGTPRETDRPDTAVPLFVVWSPLLARPLARASPSGSHD
jgi:hypothetical protein